MSQKVKINETIVSTYSYLKGNFSEDDFILNGVNNSDVLIDNSGVLIDFGDEIKDNISELSCKINGGVNKDIINDLIMGKFINVKVSEENAELNLKECLNGGVSAVTFNMKCDEDKTLYVNSKISGSGDQFNYFYYINAKRNSKVTLIVFTSSSSKGFINVLGEIEDDAHVEVLFVNVNKNNVYTNCELYLNGNKSSGKIDVCYICTEDFKYDYNLTSAMLGKESDALINGKGILLDNSKKIFRGAIDFKKGCLNANGNETEEVIVLSKNVFNQSLPLLLCNEKNVKGSHGFTANSINKDKVFYLLSRGFTEKQAKGLILQGKFLNILSKIRDKEIINKFMDILMEAI